MAQESIEVSVARLDERLKGFQTIFEQMADDQRRMAESYEELVKSNQRLALVEAEVVSLKDGQKLLWTKYDQIESDAKKTRQKWLWKIAEIALTMAAGVIAMKVFGIHI
jgi:hypothetical protein